MSGHWPLTARRVLFEHLGRLYADGAVGGVILTGPAGVGKTRLGEELLAAATNRPVARAVGHPATQEIPLGALAHLLPRGLTSDVGIGQDEATALFHRAHQHLATGDDGERLVLLIDDVDQLDATSLALLLPLTIERSIFLIATLRAGRSLPPVVATLLKDGHLRLEEIPQLTRDEVATLLHRVLDQPVDDDAVSRLHDVSGGNLQILREVVRRAIQDDSLHASDGVWVLDELPTSSTLHELVGSQLGALAERELTVMELLGVAGRLGLRALETVAPLEVVHDLEQRGLVAVTRDERRTHVTLGHPIYGEIIRQRMGVLRRRELHVTLGDLLETLGARRREDVPQLALWRLETGGAVDVAVLVDAGRLALIGRDATLAGRFADEAANRGRVHDAAIINAEAAALRGDHSRLESVVASLRDDPTLPQAQRAHLARRLADSHFNRSDLEAALQALESAERSLTEPGPTAEVRAHRARLLANNGHPFDALRIVDEIGPIDDPRVRIELSIAESIGCLSVGRFDDAIAAARRGSQSQQELPSWLSRRGAASHLINEAHALTYSGRHAEARNLVEHGLARARDSGAGAAIVWFEIVLGEIARDTGRGHDTVRHFSTAAGHAESAGQTASLVWAWVGVAQGHLLLGDLDPAATALERADTCDSPVATSWGTRERTRAWLYAGHGDLPAARELIVRVSETAQRDGMRNFECGVVHDLVRFGEPASALERLEQLSELVEGPSVQAMTTHARAATREDADEYARAIEQFEAMDSLVYAAEAAMGAAELRQRRGEHRAATALAQQARLLVDRAGGALTPPMLRSISVDPLSDREREVALLAASGVSSKEIADRLYLSKRTVDSHLNRVYRKLGVAGRTELAEALSVSISQTPGQPNTQ